MNGLERKFWLKIKSNLPVDWMERVENKISPGCPDIDIMNDGYCSKVEIKATESFPSRINYEQAQPNWLTRYWDAGGTCYTFLHVRSENKIYAWYGKDARELNKSDGTKSVKPALVVIANAKGWLELYDLFSCSHRLR